MALFVYLSIVRTHGEEVQIFLGKCQFVSQQFRIGYQSAYIVDSFHQSFYRSVSDRVIGQFGLGFIHGFPQQVACLFQVGVILTLTIGLVACGFIHLEVADDEAHLSVIDVVGHGVLYFKAHVAIFLFQVDTR